MRIGVQALGYDRLHQRVYNGLSVYYIVLGSEEPMLAVCLAEIGFLLKFFVIKIEGILVKKHLI